MRREVVPDTVTPSLHHRDSVHLPGGVVLVHCGTDACRRRGAVPCLLVVVTGRVLASLAVPAEVVFIRHTNLSETDFGKLS